MPPADDGHDVEQLVELSRVLVTVAYRALDAVNGAVSLTQFRALLVLDRQGPSNAGDLAQQLGLHPSSITRLCDKLVEARYLVRDLNPDNRREVELSLTPRGRRLVRKVLDARSHQVGLILEALPRQIRPQLAALLPVLLATAREVVESPHQAFAV